MYTADILLISQCEWKRPEVIENPFSFVQARVFINQLIDTPSKRDNCDLNAQTSYVDSQFAKQLFSLTSSCNNSAPNST